MQISFFKFMQIYKISFSLQNYRQTNRRSLSPTPKNWRTDGFAIARTHIALLAMFVKNICLKNKW